VRRDRNGIQLESKELVFTRRPRTDAVYSHDGARYGASDVFTQQNIDAGLNISSWLLERYKRKPRPGPGGVHAEKWPLTRLTASPAFRETEVLQKGRTLTSGRLILLATLYPVIPPRKSQRRYTARGMPHPIHERRKRLSSGREQYDTFRGGLCGPRKCCQLLVKRFHVSGYDGVGVLGDEVRWW